MRRSFLMPFNGLTFASPTTNILLTKDTIQNVLLMENPYEISKSPNKPNITYAVEYMQKDTEHELFFWLAC